MGISKKTSLSDHKKWEIMFNSLKQMLRKQAEQLNSLIEQRTYLQQRIQLQFERWKSDVHMFEDVLSQVLHCTVIFDFKFLGFMGFPHFLRFMDCVINFIF